MAPHFLLFLSQRVFAHRDQLVETMRSLPGNYNIILQHGEGTVALMGLRALCLLE